MKKAKKAKKPATKASKSAVKKAGAAKAVKKSGIGFRPTNDRVVIKPIAPETMTSFGIIVPDTSKEKPEQGVVVAVGPGRRSESGERIAMDVSVGDKVFFKKPWDEPIKVNGAEYYIIAEQDITLIQE